MFKQDDVHKKLGVENLRIIRNAIRRGIIKIDQIRAMARTMGGTVLGIFTEKENKDAPVAVFDFMLDTWYEEVLCQPGIDGVKAIKKILSDEDVGLNSLAMKMVPLQSVDGKVLRDSEESLALPQKSSSLLTLINMRKEGDQGNLEQWKGTRNNTVEFVVSTEPSQSSRLLSNQEDANPPLSFSSDNQEHGQSDNMELQEQTIQSTPNSEGHHLQPLVPAGPDPGNSDRFSGHYQAKTGAGKISQLMCRTTQGKFIIAAIFVLLLIIIGISILPVLPLTQTPTPTPTPTPTSIPTPTSTPNPTPNVPFLYRSGTTFLDMSTLQVISCNQQFPAELSSSHSSQGEVVQVHGSDRIVLCGEDYIIGCWVWTSSGWQCCKMCNAAGSLLEGESITRGYDGQIYFVNVVNDPSIPDSRALYCQVTVGRSVFVIGGYNSHSLIVSKVCELK